jgi:hypothetical protein
MKTVKNILVSLLLSSVILCYFGQGFVEYYGYLINDIENTNSNAGSQSIVTSEPSMEEEISFVFPVNSVQIINSGSERLFSFTCISPVHLVYPVWLPPEVS